MASQVQLKAGHQEPTGYLHADTVALIERLAAAAARDVLAERKRLSDTGGFPARIYHYAGQRLRNAQDDLGAHSSSAVAAQALHSHFLQLVGAV